MSITAPIRPYTSPLAHVDHVYTHVRPLADREVLRSRENDFINDAIETSIYSAPRRDVTIIPDYDAINDRACLAFFQSPHVQQVMRVTLNSEDNKVSV